MVRTAFAAGFFALALGALPAAADPAQPAQTARSADLSAQMRHAEVSLLRSQLVEVAVRPLPRQPIILPDQEVQQVCEEHGLLDAGHREGDVEVGCKPGAKAVADTAEGIVRHLHQFDVDGDPGAKQGLRLRLEPVDWPRAFQQAESLARRFSPTLRPGGHDLVLVAAALTMGGTWFLSFDRNSRQRPLAAAAVLRVGPPLEKEEKGVVRHASQQAAG